MSDRDPDRAKDPLAQPYPRTRSAVQPAQSAPRSSLEPAQPSPQSSLQPLQPLQSPESSVHSSLESSESAEAFESFESFDNEEFLSTKPPPADVHNASTAVANLPSTLLDSLRSPNAKLDSASISELLATSLAQATSELQSEARSPSPSPPPPLPYLNEDDDEPETTLADLESLPLLDEPDPPLEQPELEADLALTQPEGVGAEPIAEVNVIARAIQTDQVRKRLQLPNFEFTWSSKTLVLVAIAVALGIIGTATWLIVGLFQ